jgi:serine phosphatase RsbU (regulator of sigma subunit)
MYLRSRNPGEFAGMGRKVFVARALVAVLRMLTPSIPPGRGFPQRESSGTPPRPDWQTYRVLSFCRPCEQVGGDCFCVDGDGAGGLWVFVADVTGHGYLAYILADGLGYLWRTNAIAGRRTAASEPRDVLDVLDMELAPVLPDEVFVEAVLLGRFPAPGDAQLAGAGMCRVLLRRSGSDPIEVHPLGGTYLGLGLGQRDQIDLALSSGDEMALASDGLYEQLDAEGRQIGPSLPGRIGELVALGRTLHDAVLEVVEHVLRECCQRDDITIVTVCSQSGACEDRPETAASGSNIYIKTC